MRQQQQRSRNRNRGRKSTNPNSRNFESNGPDVKIRGNASHIAEKYSVLARDALTSGDTVMAENYFQHAEHYFRIVAIAQQNAPQNTQNTQNSQQNRHSNDDNRNQNTDSRNDSRGDGPQPELEDTPAEVTLKNNDSDNKKPTEDASVEAPAEEASPRARRNGRRPANNRRTTRVAAKKDDTPESGEADGLSKDAASLPSGLIGGTGDEEKAAAVDE